MKISMLFNVRRWIVLIRSPLVLSLAVLLVSMAAGAVNVNGNAASLSLSTTELSSGTVQANGAGARLLAAGTPSVGVVSTNGAGAKVIVEPLNAIIGGGPPAPGADFTANPLSGAAPLPVQFISPATVGVNAILTWEWDFGDGSPIGAEHNPQHTYDTPGTYSVTLTVTTEGGPFSKTKSNYITVTQGGLPATSGGALLILAGIFAVAGGVLIQKRAKPEDA